jgi:hypothetical protein
MGTFRSKGVAHTDGRGALSEVGEGEEAKSAGERSEQGTARLRG